MGNRVFITDACRTPIGRAGGGLAEYTEVELLTYAIDVIVKRKLQVVIPDELIVGCCFGQEKRNLAKKVAMKSSLPYSIPAVTTNRTCASSMEALVQGYYRIWSGDADIVLVGGTENMSANPNVMKMNIQNVRKYIKEGQPFTPISMSEEELVDSIGMAVDIMARNNRISRLEQDIYAATSHYKADYAWNKGIYNDEVVPCYTHSGELIMRDEGTKECLSMQEYQQSNPLYFKDGNITKYNASPISDGAAAMLLVSEKILMKYRITPIAEIVTSSLIGGNPSEIGTIAAKAYLKLMKKVQLRDTDIGMIECNEAYAAQVLACIRIAKWDETKLNIYGGSLALGHPLGCSGLRICTTLIYGMRRQDIQYGVATMCAGGGMGQAVLFRRDNRWG